MSNKTFFLISNGSSEIYSDNTLTNFKNRLPEVLDLPENENWVAAVESVGFSSRFKNVHIPDKVGFPSFILGNCKKNINSNQNSGCKTIYEQHKCPTIHFDFIDNEDNENCIWSYHTFENKMYSKSEIKQYFYDVTTNSKIKNINLVYDDKIGALEFSNIGHEDKGTANYWLLIHPSMIHTFGIPITPMQITGSEYWKKVGANRFTLVKINVEGNEEEVNTNTPYTTYYKNEKYFAYAMWYLHAPLKCNPSSVFTDPDRRFPKVIKVLCDNIKPQTFNSSHSQDLIVFCPDFSNKEDKYYFKEFENKQYVKIANSVLSDFSINLCDENNNKLQLISGVPSIVKISIKKMEEQTFNVRLTSAKSKEFPENNNSIFKVQLPSSLSLNRNWSVALTAINHPNHFSTFIDEINTNSIIYRHKPEGAPVQETLRFDFDVNRRYDKKEIISEIKKFFASSDIGDISVTDNNLVQMIFNRKGILVASNYLLQILGYDGYMNHNAYLTFIHVDDSNTASYLEKDITDGKYKINCKLGMDMDVLRPDYMIAYSNIVSSSIIGGIYSKILRIIPVYKSDEDYVIKEFKHKEYIQLQNTEINEIEIELRSHDGLPISFSTKKDIILNLEFKYEEKNRNH